MGGGNPLGRRRGPTVFRRKENTLLTFHPFGNLAGGNF